VLDGHAKCIVTPEFKRAVKVAMGKDTALTYEVVALSLGLTPSIVRAWTYPIGGGE
jgi:hypothetical protein